MDNEFKNPVVDMIEEYRKNQVVEGNVLKVTDLSWVYDHLFSDEAKAAMARKVVEFRPARNHKIGPEVNGQAEYIRVLDKVEYFSVTARNKSDLYEAAKYVANEMNEYAAKGFIAGCLVPLSVLQLTIVDLSVPFVVFCFLSFTKEGSEYLDSNKSKIHTQEGGIGPDLKDLIDK